MHQLPIEQQILLVIQGLALVGLCVRLWSAGLHKVYTCFFAFLVVELLQVLVPVVVPVSSPAYRDVFVLTEALVVVCYALIVLELYSIILKNLAGIASVSRRYIKVTLRFAILVSLLPLLIEKPQDTVTGYLFDFEAPVVSSLVIFLLLISVFLVYYPVPLNRNVMNYLLAYEVLFVSRTTILFINNMGHYLTRLWGSSLMAVYAACVLFWVAVLDRKGEAKTVVIGHQWNRADEARLLARLEAINGSLLRAARK